MGRMLKLICGVTFLFIAVVIAQAAPPDRVTRPIDTRRTQIVPGHLRSAARRQLDAGAADPAMPMEDMALVVKPSAAQQADIERLLIEQQNAMSPIFRRWLTPEQFGERFGLNAGDETKISRWLESAGFTVLRRSRSHNWIAFRGTAGQVAQALGTPIHRFQVNGEMHFANTREPAVPEALADVVGGFLGLNDFHLQPMVRRAADPDFNSGSSHYLAPADYATIYDIAPLYGAGIDGTGQAVAVVGASEISLNDIRAFRSRYGLPANDPQLILYSGVSPGFNSAEIEGDLDLEWSGAIAPNATIYYVYGPDAFEAIVAAVDMNVAPTPSFAGVLALLNHYQVSQGFAPQAGLGNINPQLYRMSQAVPGAFHDVTTGDNYTPCAQGSPDCLTGSFGYAAGAGYDMATGLGSLDVNTLVKQWNAQAAGVMVVLQTPAQVTVNDMVTASVTVSANPGEPGGTPTGTVSFSIGGIALTSTALAAGTATVNFPVYQLGVGTFLLEAVYAGDSVFSGGSANATIKVTTPANASAIVISGPNTVFASLPDAAGLSWQTNILLQETAGVAALVTGFSIDGVAQSLASYFASPEIPAGGSVAISVVFRNLATPVTRTFAFTGTDAAGQAWTRQLAVIYYPSPTDFNFNLTATPLEVTQNPAADASCQWAAQIHVDETSGYQSSITKVLAGSTDLSSQIAAIFGATRLEAWGSLTGTICFGGIAPPAANYIEVDLSNGYIQEVLVEFDGPPPAPVTLSGTSAQVSLAATGQPAQATVSIGISDPAQSWTASIFPANRTTGWLSVSQLSGTGPAAITLTASGTGYEPGVYNATIVLESLNAQPQQITVPVMFVLGGSSSGTTITGVANAASQQPVASPGMVLAISGMNLANTGVIPLGSPWPYSAGGISAVVNGVAAPLLGITPELIQIQVPYTVGAGPGVVGINNNGEIAGFPIQIAASSPGIYADANGNPKAQSSAAQGGTATLTATGVGDVPSLRTGFAAPAASPFTSPSASALPVAVTVGGEPALLQSVAMLPGSVGVANVNFIVPATVAVGPQPVVLTVGGVASPAVNLTVTAAAGGQ